MTQKDIHLALTGRLTYEDEITIAQATQVIALLNDAPLPPASTDVGVDGSRSGASADAGSALRPTAHRTVSNPRDALDVSGAKTNPEKIVALAAYVLQDGELETFTVDTIRPLFKRARESSPANITRDLDSAIKSGWVADGDERGEFYLTSKAENVLEMGFEEIRSVRNNGQSKPRASANKKPKSVDTPQAFAEIEEFPTVMEGYPPYHQVKLKRDKLLWAIMLAKTLGVAKVQNKEMVWLTDKLGEGIQSNDINGHYRGLQRPGYVNRSTIDNAMRITQDGESYLRSLVTQDS